MLSKFSVTLKRLIDEFELETVYLPGDPEQILISNTNVMRPSLPLAGFTEFFDNTHLQIIGHTEIAYIERLRIGVGLELAVARCNKFFSLKPPAVIICGDQPCPDYMLRAAKNNEVPLFRSPYETSEFISTMIYWLNKHLAPRITRHGVLMEIYGEGVLILGESGIGKSETAVELIVRGHCLIADDAVEIRRVSSQSLVGTSPNNIRHFMELRGVGIINARRIFGSGSVKVTQKIELIIRLETWNDRSQYDRFGLTRDYMEILGIKVPVLTIPVKPGRNLAVIIETAAMNFRLNRMGYNATRELMRGLGVPDDDMPAEERRIEDTGWDDV